MKEHSEATIAPFVISNAIPLAWLGYAFSEAPHLGGFVVGRLCGMCIGISLAGIFAPKSFCVDRAEAGKDTESPFDRVFGSIVMVCVLVPTSFGLHFFVDVEIWLGVITIAMAAGALAVSRVAGVDKIT